MQATSSLTFKVLACSKNVLVVLFSCWLGDATSPAQLLGYLVSVAGTVAYTLARTRRVKLD